MKTVCFRATVADKKPKLQSFQKVIAVVDFLCVVVYRNGMKEIVLEETDPVHVYWKSACKLIVVQLVGVVVGISEQLLYVRERTDMRVHCANKRFRHVG